MPAGQLIGRSGERFLEVAHPAALDEQAAAGQSPESLQRSLTAHPGGRHGVDQQVRDAHSRRAGAVNDDALVGEFGVGGRHCRQDGCDYHAGGALDVVIEGRDLVAVAVQDAVCVAGREVFPVQQCLREAGRDLLHEAVHELVVAFAAYAGVPHTQVGGIVEQIEVVGSGVEDDRHDSVGMDAGGGDVDAQLADADRDTPDALVTDAQDSLGVGHHDQVDIVWALAVGEQRRSDGVRIVDVEVDAARLVEPVAVLLDDLPDGGGVDDRQHLLDVLGEQPVEQCLVAVLHRRQVEVLGQVTGLLTELTVDAAQLGVHADHRVR